MYINISQSLLKPMSCFRVFLNVKKISLSIEILFMFFPLRSRSFSYIYVNTLMFRNCLMYIIVALSVFIHYCHFFIILSIVNLVIGFLKFVWEGFKNEGLIYLYFIHCFLLWLQRWATAWIYHSLSASVRSIKME